MRNSDFGGDVGGSGTVWLFGDGDIDDDGDGSYIGGGTKLATRLPIPPSETSSTACKSDA